MSQQSLGGLHILGLVLVASTAASPAAAVEVTGLYRAETIITGTGEPETTRGLRICLTDVVVKLTGDPRLADGGRIAPLLADPHAYVAGVAYEDRMKGVPVHDEQGTRERPHFLRAAFDPAALDSALAGLGLPRWPSDRPRVRVLMTVATAAERYLVLDDGPEGYGQRMALRETAARLGLPLVLPAAAFADGERGGGADGDAVLSGDLSLAEDGFWDMRWRLAWQGGERAWSVEGVTFDEAIRNGLNATALVLSGNRPP